jgi:putative peptide zinc metalloprotease protein
MVQKTKVSADSGTPQPAPASVQEGGARSAPLPDRPQLAPGIELSGAMAESGFSEQQWLIQRAGQFIQVTELLYRVAEQIDGNRNLDELAAAVSGTTKRKVSADNVRQLIQSKLIPLGVVLGADGKAAVAAGGGQGAAARALRVNLKMGMISPHVINPVTATLQVFYWPLVLALMLAAAGAALVWLFFVHGIGASVRNAIYQPGLLLAALGLIIAAAAFHEFGHASALRYGGGKVREMGFGIYLIYPAFYTDVSDNYRLGRWSRVRTDLGGFYFHMLFALAMIAIYFGTHAEFLLLVVVLIAFDIFRQLMPFVRLDGYWALADITGIPDFFSHMGAFLRTVLPLQFWKGPKLANLKAWVKVVYGLYIIITVPLLLLVVFGMLRGVPRVLASAWESFGHLAGQLGAAHSHGSVLGMAASLVQMLTLALPTLGMLYILFSLARGLSSGAWSWSRGSAKRRTLVTAGGMAVVALLLYMWAPQIPLTLLGRGRAQPLAAQNVWRPIEPTDRGTVWDAAAAVPFVGPQVASRYAPAAESSAPPIPAAQLTPTAPAVASSTATASATPSATASATVTVTATPIRTATASSAFSGGSLRTPIATSQGGVATREATRQATSTIRTPAAGLAGTGTVVIRLTPTRTPAAVAQP